MYGTAANDIHPALTIRERLQNLADENAKLREERDHLLMNSNPTATELRRVRSAWKKDRDENDRLKSENARLREYIERKQHLQDFARLVDENSKLRELVRILKNCADECGDCDTCPINGKSGVLNPWLGCDSLRDRMHELGIEVDE